MCNFQNIKCKTDMCKSESLQLKWMTAALSLFCMGVHSSSNRNDGMPSSSTRHHRLRVRQIRCEVFVRKCQKDDIQVQQWLDHTYEEIVEFRHESGPRRPRWNARWIPCLATGPLSLRCGTVAVRLSYGLSWRKAIGWSRFAISEHWCAFWHVTWKADMKVRKGWLWEGRTLEPQGWHEQRHKTSPEKYRSEFQISQWFTFQPV